MPVFLTRTTNFKTKVDAFQRRGLDNQSSAKVSELSIIAVSPKPIENVIRFSHMSSELKGRLDGSYEQFVEVPRAMLRRFDAVCPFEGPQLIVEMKTGGEVLNGLGLFEVASSKQAIFGGQPTHDQFVQICALGIDFYQNVPAGNVNIAGYIAFEQAWKGIRALYACGGGDPGEGGAVRAYVTTEGAKGLAPVPAVPPVTDKEGALVREGRPAKEGGGWTFLHTTTIQLASGNKPAVSGIPAISTADADLEFGGLLFPYFKEMLEPDVDFAYNVFISLYALCLEDGEGPTSEAINVHRRGFRYLANSYAGRIIQHVYLGVRLAIDTGAALILVKDGSEYAGFVLRSASIRVALQNKVYSALSAADLSAELASMDIHNKTLISLYDLIVAQRRMDGAEEARTLDELKKNPRILREMIQMRYPEDIDTIRKEIGELIVELKYQQTFKSVSKANVVQFMSSMNLKTPLLDEPMYIHLDVLCNRSSDILSYLSVFGAQAPSIYHGSKTLSIAHPDKQDPSLEVVDGRSKVPHMPFVIKGLTAAALDWASTYRQKSFKFTPAQTKYGGRGFSSAKGRDGFVDAPEFEGFYRNLRQWVYTGVAEKGGKGKKRKSAGEGDMSDDEDRPPAPKKNKFVYL